MSLFTEAKALRILGQGRLDARCENGELVATVRGDHGVYVVRLGPRGPECSCPSLRRRCSHGRAFELIAGAER